MPKGDEIDFERTARMIVRQVVESCGGDELGDGEETEDLLFEIEWKLREARAEGSVSMEREVRRLRAELAEAVAAEREACARLADETAEDERRERARWQALGRTQAALGHHGDAVAEGIARRIRARGQGGERG